MSICFKRHRFKKAIILLCIRWYLRYPLSYRQLEEIMRERGLEVDHTTIIRWVNKFTPKLEAEVRTKNHKKTVGSS